MKKLPFKPGKTYYFDVMFFDWDTRETFKINDKAVYRDCIFDTGAYMYHFVQDNPNYHPVVRLNHYLAGKLFQTAEQLKLF